VISGLCESSKAAIDFIHDLAPGPFTALNDEALRAFPDESGEAGMTGAAWTDRRPRRTPSTCRCGSSSGPAPRSLLQGHRRRRRIKSPALPRRWALYALGRGTAHAYDHRAPARGARGAGRKRIGPAPLRGVPAGPARNRARTPSG
jgi:hypothetical protein